MNTHNAKNMMFFKMFMLVLLGIMALVGSCRDAGTKKITGIELSIQYDTQLNLDQFVIAGFLENNQQAFEPGTVPDPPHALTSGKETTAILLPNDLGGQTIALRVHGLSEGNIVGSQQLSVLIESKRLTPVSMTLGDLAICGDGQIREGIEECDDEDTDPGDGCDESCLTEESWTCVGEPSVCVWCGNGSCEWGEDVCTCPADCTDANCGDGNCCATGGETSETCTPDCGNPQTNKPPIAAFVVDPGAGDTTTEFSFDASPSSDDLDADTALTFSWDFDGDGVFDETGMTPTHTFGITGFHNVKLEVEDTGGLVDEYNGSIVVAAPGNVTDVATETQFSDAIDYANAHPGHVIQIPADTTITMTGTMPVITAANTTIIGGENAVLDCALSAPRAVFSQAKNCSILWLEIQNCSESGIENWPEGLLVANCDIHDNGYNGIGLGGTDNAVIQNNRIHDNARDGIDLDPSTGISILDNTIFGNGKYGINVDTGVENILISGNVIYKNVEQGIFDEGQASNVAYWHNTVHSNGLDGIAVVKSAGGTAGSGYDLRNNILSNNGGYGILASDGTFDYLDYNNYYSNTSGTCSGAPCSMETHGFVFDPDYRDVAADDYRLNATSQCIDKGFDLGIDRNGSGPGNYYGTGPDIGADEVQ